MYPSNLEESGKEGSGCGWVKKKGQRKCALKAANSRNRNTKFLREGKGPCLPFVAEAEVNTEYFPTTFQGIDGSDIKYKFAHHVP